MVRHENMYTRQTAKEDVKTMLGQKGWDNPRVVVGPEPRHNRGGEASYAK